MAFKFVNIELRKYDLEMIIKLSCCAIAIFAVLVGLLACQKKSGTFYAAALGLEKDLVIVSSQLPTVLSVAAFNLDGSFRGILADYQTENNGPRGLALFDLFHLVVSLDGDDRLDLIYLGGGRSSFIQSSFLSGAIGKLIRNPADANYFVIESNTMIERFSSSGDRIPVTGNPFVNGALAPCAAPGSLRSLVINNNGDLIAVQSGTTTAFRYTIGPTTASACVSIPGLPGNATDIINHSDGSLYWVSTNNQVYRASQTLTGSTSIFNSPATISTPTALAELPNGDLIIASDGTDSLQVISTDGTYRGAFHKGVNTQQINSILVVRGQ